ncbi:MAG: NAD(P)-dependent oxidoreductase [Anaerolineae bacterium]|nr:NAD(P)-dependent oxidoreductase [Anaerolineae bacterium]
MNVLVTGGAGEVGQAAVRRLVAHGHRVRVIGRRAGISILGAEYQACDINDFDALCEQMDGIDAVVHLAAIRHPALAPGEEMFRVNCAGTYNVYQAATRAGIKRVISASSINALGYFMGVKPLELRYFPVDEAHPTQTTDPYSFSKQIIEEIAAYFWRREGISGLCLRFPAVYEVGEGKTPMLREWITRWRAAHEELFALPEAERRARARSVSQLTESLREKRVCEWPFEEQLAVPQIDLVYARSNFWTSIDARDAAQAIEKGLLADYEGSHAVFCNDSENCVGVPSQQLVETFFPDVATFKRHLVGVESVVSIDKIRRLIGFEPEHHVDELLAG